MKRCIIMLITALLLVSLLAACGEEKPTEAAPTASPETQLHVVPPTDVEPEPEWAYIDAAMTLQDDATVYAKGSDFIAFALVGSGDKAELRFRISDTAAKSLRDKGTAVNAYLTVNGTKIGDVQFSETCEELTLVGSFTYEKLCQIANNVRGLP